MTMVRRSQQETIAALDASNGTTVWEYTYASATGDHLRGNAAAEVVAAVYGAPLPDAPRATLLQLVNDDDEAVRSWAVAHAPEFAPAVGERASTCSRLGRVLQRSAPSTTLPQRRVGRLTPP